MFIHIFCSLLLHITHILLGSLAVKYYFKVMVNSEITFSNDKVFEEVCNQFDIIDYENEDSVSIIIQSAVQVECKQVHDVNMIESREI